MDQQDFNDQWIIDEMPACGTGMELLKHFSDAHPEIPLSELRILAWSDPTDPFITADPRWQAYSRHVGDCPDCNEV